MAKTKSTVANGMQVNDVLTIPEAAAYLRVPEDVLLMSTVDGLVPGRKLGEEWRFSKQALTEWLGSGGRMSLPLLQDWLAFLEHRIIDKAKPEAVPKPGSKEAVLTHFGIFRDDNDLEERLAQLRRFREETA